MKNNPIIGFLTLLLAFGNLYFNIAQVSAQVIEIQRISPNDSELYFFHKVRKAESLFSIARTYDLSLKEIEEYNPGVNLKFIAEAQMIKLPAKIHNLRLDSVAGALPVIYRVLPKDNFFAIKHRILKRNETELLKLNPKLTKSLKAGDAILVGFLKFKLAIEPIVAEDFPTKDDDMVLNEPIVEVIPNAAHSRGLAMVEEKGLGEGRYFALHATALIESSIAITNPINLRTVYAKVIGRIPPIYNSDVQIVVSSSVARFLGIPDHRFYASIAYQKGH